MQTLVSAFNIQVEDDVDWAQIRALLVWAAEGWPLVVLEEGFARDLGEADLVPCMGKTSQVLPLAIQVGHHSTLSPVFSAVRMDLVNS